MLWLMLLLIGVFLAGTFLYSWRLLKQQSRREESVDKSKLREWEDDDDWPWNRHKKAPTAAGAW